MVVINHFKIVYHSYMYVIKSKEVRNPIILISLLFVIYTNVTSVQRTCTCTFLKIFKIYIVSSRVK